MGSFTYIVHETAHCKCLFFCALRCVQTECGAARCLLSEHSFRHVVMPGPHWQQCRSNIVEATGNFVVCCFDNVDNATFAFVEKINEISMQTSFDIVAGVDRA